MEIKPVAYYHGPFGSKFAVPRQSGVVGGIRGRIVLAEGFRSGEYIRGLDGFGRIWLIWGFSANREAGRGATVRPPRLGGNERVGVFATRSPFRPNPLGLSCVQVERIETDSPEGPVIHVLGADLVDGTPIYDIKPYVPYADSFPDSAASFAAKAPEEVLEVVEGPEWVSPFDPEETEVLKRTLSLDPRPAFHDDPERVYGFPFRGTDVRFKVEGKRLILLETGAISAKR